MDNKALILDLVEWLAPESRRYEDVMSAWKTSCPRLTVWEDAVDARLVSVTYGSTGKIVSVTDKGRDFLCEARGSRAAS